MDISQIITSIEHLGTGVFGSLWPTVWIALRAVGIVAPLLLCVAYLTLWERKLIGWMQVRIGPNRVGPFGLFQPIADGLKLILKEIVLPTASNKALFFIAPVLTIMPAMAAWAVIPFGPEIALSNINAGLLYLMAITSIGVYGIIIAGWASNSKYPFLGAMRASAQMISYELTMGFVLVAVLMVSGSLNLTKIVEVQTVGFFASKGWNFLSWNWLPLLPLFVIYVISAVAETHRHPFDIVEGESEIVAGHMVEYSGMSFAIFFLAEYANMILLATMTSIMFLGGWQAPFDLALLNWLPGWIWLCLKAFFILSMFIWFRATFPRYRYDQIMRLGWKIFIPITLIGIVVLAVWINSPYSIWHAAS